MVSTCAVSMDLSERRLAVAGVLLLLFAVRLIAHRAAGGMARDQSDGIALEGGRSVALALRLTVLVFGLIPAVIWCVAPTRLPGQLDLPDITYWAALASALAGLLLLIFVHRALGRQFSGTLHLRDDHQLVTHGPYSRIRHPMYTAFLLLLGGLATLIGNAWIAVVLLGSQVWVLLVRLPLEEAQLNERFGQAWQEHCHRTGRLLPRWRNSR
ncbi:MAG: isoprenylcysteine carboxylmethyltransferase family protein [Pseudomonadota bacterium]